MVPHRKNIELPWEHQTVNILQGKHSCFVRIIHTNKYGSTVSGKSRNFSVQPRNVLQIVNGEIFVYKYNVRIHLLVECEVQTSKDGSC